MNKFSNFHTVQDLKFDINKLQKSLSEVLKIKNYDSAGGIAHFGAICLRFFVEKFQANKILELAIDVLKLSSSQSIKISIFSLISGKFFRA